jgi:predicted TIM-barrel fold metal-dependent hydrolase
MSYLSTPSATSLQVAEEWRPYIETCIEAFGAQRLMLESNFPFDSADCICSFLWNASKRLAFGASKDDKTALFGGSARHVCRLDL